MKLLELFESTTKDVAIIFGRFNPPHKGHKAAWEMMKEYPYWFVGTNSETQGPKDPLPFEIKTKVMKAIYPDLEGHLIAEKSWLTLASKVYNKHPSANLLVFTDEDWVTKTIIQYNGVHGKSHGFYNFKNIEQRPTPRLSSATSLRDAVKNGDKEAFTKAAGIDADTKIENKTYFDLVKEYLLSYNKNSTKEEIEEANYGRYWCSTDKKWKYRKGPKQKRKS